MEALPGWSTDGSRLTRTFEFQNFVEAADFVKKLSKPAEKSGHYPDIIISFNQVIIKLATYDVGELTDQDITLIETIVNLYSEYKK